jgi:predicted nucleic acid-binding protein
VITAVDTNVLLDVLASRPAFVDASSAALIRCLEEGSLSVCDVVWTELAAAIGSAQETDEKLKQMEVNFSVLVQPSAELAAKAWREYRKQGGSRSRLAPDFLIGGHALLQADRLLTRDRGFYRKCFKKLDVLDPTA